VGGLCNLEIKFVRNCIDLQRPRQLTMQYPDFEPLKHDYRIGLETLIVHALNQWVLYVEKLFLRISLRANTSPGD